MKLIKRIACAVILAVMMISGISFSSVSALADAKTEAQTQHFPKAGSKVKKDDRLTIDYSHMDQGYVMVKAKKTDKRMQLIVKHGSDSLYYEINGLGEYVIIPLQFGSGKYTFTLMIVQKKGGRECNCAGNITLKCRMKDESSCFLYPNQYVNYDAESPFVEKAGELCKGLTKPKDIARAVCKYVLADFKYDHRKKLSIKVKKTKNLLPDIETTWKTKKGVCNDLSALTCAMLRSQGIPAKLAIGRADGSYHAWVVIIIDGKTKRFDPSFSARSYKAERYY